MNAGKRKALGRGLAALIPEAPAPDSKPGTTADDTRTGERLLTVPIEEVHPGRAHQPRKTFDEGPLAELAESIRVQGIIQPLVVRRMPGGGGGAGYEIIAGERRWRAAQKAGLHEVPVVVREVEEARAFEMALVENLQRADLNPIEEAEGYQRLVDEFGYTQELLAGRVGKERSTVANALRLLKLPPSVREQVVAGRLSMGHARAILGLEDLPAMERLARQAIARGMSVRQVELLVRKERDAGKPEANGAAGVPPAAPARPSPAARDLQERLQRALGVRVRLVEAAPGKGHLELHYGSLDELDGLLGKILPG